MNLEGSPDDDRERDCTHLGERFILGAVRLASLPLFLLVIILSSVIYGVAMLARILAVLISPCFRVVGPSTRSWNEPVKVHDI